MACVTDLLRATPEGLINSFSKLASVSPRLRGPRIATQLGLNEAQLICGIGFNKHIRTLTEVVSTLGYASYDRLAHRRNTFFVKDAYTQLSLGDVLAIYGAVKDDLDILAVMQYLLTARLANLEAEIEATVKVKLIEGYKAEIRSIYLEGIAQADFAEARIENTPSGFRVLVNEIKFILHCKLIPVGDILFREAVVPEEKRKIIERGLVPKSLISSRMQDKHISPQERAMLENYLRLNG